MIKLVAVLIALLSFAFLRQSPVNSYTKPYKDGTGTFLVKYTFDARHSLIRPKYSEPQAPHYNAEVRVFRVTKTGNKSDTVAVGAPLQGVYVEAGCTDDQPAEWVRRAKNSHQ